ncbi:MAG: hypothetical protein ACQEST_02245 [Bacteroidota bacterium]
MIKKAYILTILFVGIFSYNAHGQETAQATMRVSATIVSGTTIDTEKPEMIYLSENEKFNLGTLKFKGIEEGEVFISNSPQITLTNKNGNKLKMNINRNDHEENTDGIQFDGSTEEEMMSSVYRGKLTTSIEYF